MGVSAGYELLAPTLLRSHTLSAPYRQLHAGKLPAIFTVDEELARSVRELVPTAPFDALR